MKNKLLILIFGLAFLLRFIGTNPGYNPYHSDEPAVYGSAIEMITKNSLDPVRYDYPAAAMYVNFLFFKFVFIPLSWIQYYLTNIPEIIDGTVHIPISSDGKDVIFTTVILGNREVNSMFWGRYVTALFSFGTVVLVYLIGKKLFSKEVGLIAAFLLTFDFKTVANSHIGLPDTYNSFFLILAVLTAINLWKKPNSRNYLISGLCAGLSFATKYQFLGLFPYLVIHFYLSFEKRKFDLRKFFNLYFFAGCLVIPLIFLVTNPYLFIHLPKALRDIQDVSLKYGMGTNAFNFFPLSYLYNIDFGPIEFIVVFLGLIFATIKFPKKMFIFWPILIGFGYIFLYYSKGGFYVRNLITIVPILFIFAAVFLYEAVIPARKFLPLILILIVFIPAKNSFLNSYYNTKKWTYNLTTEWLYKHIPDGTVVGANPFDPPTGSPNLVKTNFTLDGSFSLAEHREDKDEYVLINLDWAGGNFYAWMSFGLNDLRHYWVKPLNEMRNTYWGLAAEEIFRYQVFTATKPWQAPDAALVLAKIPKFPKVEMVVIKNFDFRDNNSWQPIGFKSSENFYDNNALVLSGSVDSRFPIKRITSPLINVKPGHEYLINGFIKGSEIFTKDQRDGFLRVDFYNHEPDLGEIGEISSVSSRIYGTKDWVEKQIIERAPDDAKYLRISLQKNSTIDQIYLKNVTVSESKESIPDINSNSPYTKQKIDLDLLYPNSHGNL